MSITLPAVDLSSASVGNTGTVDWSKYAPQAGYAAHGGTPHLAAYNESGCGLQLTFSTGEQAYLPAGGWVSMALNPSCQNFTYQVVYTLTAPLVTKLLVVWFPPDEAVPPTPILGNSPVGGQVTTTFTIAQELEGQNQSHAFTESDQGPYPFLVPIDNTTGVGLAARSISNAIVRGLQVTGAVGFEGNIEIYTIIDQYNGIALAGNGVPTIVALASDQAITDTAVHVITSYTPGANGTYRVALHIRLANGVSGNNIFGFVAYTDSGGTARTETFAFTAGSLMLANGSTSFVNGAYGSQPLFLYCKASTAIEIRYQDPTNTPNDHLTASIEWLG